MTYHELQSGDTLCSSWSGFICVVLHVSTSKFGGAKRFTFLDLDDGTIFTEDCLDKQVRLQVEESHVNREGQVWTNSLMNLDMSILWVVVRSDGERHMLLCLDASEHTATVKEIELASGSQLNGYILWERFS